MSDPQERLAADKVLLLRATEVAPGDAGAHASLAQVLQQLGETNEALQIIDERIAKFPDAVWPLSIKAALLDADHRTEESLAVHKSIVSRIPHIAVGWVNYAHALRALGRTAEAISAYRKAIAVEPCNGSAWWGVASIRNAPLGPSDLEALQHAVTTCTDHFDRVPLHFALGRAFEDSRRFRESFQQYDAGNRLRAELIRPAAADVEALVSRSEAIFTQRLFAQRSGSGCDAEGPIFIVGMPRSGSTLLEQILASHPEVEALGELAHLPAIAATIGEPGATWPEAVVGLGAQDAANLGERYLSLVQRHRKTDRRYFTDKLPANWQLIGLIRLILPKAKIIDVRRDPMACCFANFAFYFNRETNLAAGLEDLAVYYRSYVRLVSEFEAILPEQVRTVSYERLVEDPESVTRAMLGFVGLRLDRRSLLHFTNLRAIHTPSAEQVRQPIHRASNQRWRSYARWLAPLSNALRQPSER